MRRCIVLGLLLACLSPAGWADAGGSRAALLATYQKLRAPLAGNPFGRPLHLESTETSSSLRGDVYTVIEHPFADAAAVLRQQSEWCGILTLHLNVKYCGWSSRMGGGLALYLGRKYFQTLDDAYRLDFSFGTRSVADYLQVALTAERGPFGTHDYRILLEATPVDEAHTLVHFSYAYGYGLAARFALQAYLATFGSDKLGFTLAGTRRDGSPEYVEGVRGVLERNTMRYYLAIETYLDALALPARDRLEKRLNGWFDATERYALQLHELERSEYLQMKRSEYQRQQSAPTP